MLDSTTMKQVRRDLVSAFYAGADCAPELIETAVRTWMESDDYRTLPPGYDALGELALEAAAIGPLSQHLPSLLADVARFRLMRPLEQRRGSSPFNDLATSELGRWSSPPTAYRGPFLSLLQADEQLGMDLVVDIVNHATDAWVLRERSDRYGIPGDPLPQTVTVLGVEHAYWGDALVWQWYRYPSVAPSTVTSALMALETWLNEHIEAGKDPSPLFEHLLRQARSIAIPAVLVAVTTHFPDFCITPAKPLFTCPGFYLMDRDRRQHDLTARTTLRSLDFLQEGGSAWDWVEQSAQVLYREADLTQVVFTFLYSNPELRQWLLPIIRAFPAYLPFTSAAQRDDPEATAQLRLGCEFLVQQLDVEQMDFYQSARGGIVGVPLNLPEHLRQASTEAQHLWSQTNERLVPYLWARKILDGVKDDTLSFTPEGAFAAVRALATDVTPGFPDLNTIEILTAAALIIKYANTISHDIAMWARDRLMQETARILQLATSPTHILFEDEFVAHALPYWLLYQPDDNEVSRAVIALIQHPEQSIRQASASGVARIWGKAPFVAWESLTTIMARKRPKQGVSALKNNIFMPLKLGVRKATASDWQKLEIALRLLPWRLQDVDFIWRTRLAAVYTDWQIFILHSYQETEDDPWRIPNSRTVEELSRRFYEHCSILLVLMDPQAALETFVHPLLAMTTNSPELLEIFLEQLCKAVSDRELDNNGFITVWQETGNFILSSPLVQQRRGQTARTVEQILATLIFMRPYATWNIPSWKPLSQFDTFINQWCRVVGSQPRQFRALIRLLSSIGQSVFPTLGMQWLATAFGQAQNPEHLLRTEHNGAALSEVLSLAWNRHATELASNTDRWRQYNALVDLAANVGEPEAQELQKRLRRR